MQTILHKPYLLFWAAIPLIYTMLAIGGSASTLNVQLHDTYLVLGPFFVGGLLSVVFGILGGIYWLFRKKRLIKGLTLLHVVFTLFAVLCFVLTEITLKRPAAPYYRHETLFSTGFLLMFGALQSQVLLLINLIIGLVRGTKN